MPEPARCVSVETANAFVGKVCACACVSCVCTAQLPAGMQQSRFTCVRPGRRREEEGVRVESLANSLFRTFFNHCNFEICFSSFSLSGSVNRDHGFAFQRTQKACDATRLFSASCSLGL